MSEETRASLIERLRHLGDTMQQEIAKRSEMNQLAQFRPYAKQLEFFRSSLHYRERVLMAGNQQGKTYSGSREFAYHATGLYPDWWPGRRFNRPLSLWCGSETAQVTRDTCQFNLIGPPESRDLWGTGAIPGKLMIDTSMASGNVPNAIETVTVRHVSGGTSVIGFKNYEQGRAKWQGTKKDVIWLDEEPPWDVYTEALSRTNAVEDGAIYITFTPLKGMSEVVRSFFESEREEIQYKADVAAFEASQAN